MVTPAGNMIDDLQGDTYVPGGNEEEFAVHEGSRGTPVNSSEEEGSFDEESQAQSEGYEDIFEIDTRGYLDRYELSQEQLKAIEGHILLGVDAGQKLINVSIALSEAESEIALLRQELMAAKLVIREQKGWSDRFIDKTAE